MQPENPIDKPNENTSDLQAPVTDASVAETPANLPADQSAPTFGVITPQQTTPTEQSTQPNTVTSDQAGVFGAASASASTIPTTLPQQPKKGPHLTKKQTIMAAIIAVPILLFGGGAAAYLGIIAPNKPENIWKTALERTADGYDKLVDYTQDNKSAMGKQKIKGTLKLDGPFATDGTIEGTYDDKNAIIKGDIGIMTSRVSAEIRAIDAENSEYPDLYIKASGLAGLDVLLGEAGAYIAPFDDQWVAIDHTFLDNLQSQAVSTNAATDAQLSPDDVAAIARAVGEVNRTYLFTADTSKSIFGTPKNIGKEQRDGREVYHYQVTLHKENTKAYLEALATKLDETPLKKLLGDKKVKDAISLEGMLKDIDKADNSKPADVYVDMKTKTLRAIRLHDTDSANSYVELGLNIDGNDKVPFVAKFYIEDDEGVAEITATLTQDMKTHTTDLGLDMSFPLEGETEKETVKASLTLTPTTDAVKPEKPADALTLNEILSQFYGLPLEEGLQDIEGGSSLFEQMGLNAF